MKQPQLGQRLAEIRKEKNLTQEELVEKCNVSVRTIQRIESGDVTPRSSTVKILLSALEYDLDRWNELNKASNTADESSLLGRVFISNNSLVSSSRSIQSAWIAGIIYLVISTVEIAVEFIRIDTLLEGYELVGYTALKIVAFTTFFFFIRGFVGLGHFFKNSLLVTSAYLYAVILVCLSLGDIIMIWWFQGNEMYNIVYDSSYSVLVGITQIIFGIGLLRLQDGMGRMAKLAGGLEIITGFAFVTVILFFLGLITWLPALVLEIVILFKADDLLRKEIKEADKVY